MIDALLLIVELVLIILLLTAARRATRGVGDRTLGLFAFKESLQNDRQVKDTQFKRRQNA
ncbi:hypothetical protein JZU46_05060 [bacterium]|nr:hypothetical protein [bacterium]